MAWKLLFGSDFGILSLITIGVVLVMGVYFYHFFTKHMKDPAPGSK
jgi:hypothetical protein